MLQSAASGRYALIAIIVASAVMGLALAWSPIEFLIGHTMFDDSFYYFETAHNVTSGGGVSLDREVWANGFHPLWLATLLPIYSLPLSRDAAVHASLSVSALLTSLSGVVVYMTARRLGLSPFAGAGATAAYLLNPVVVFMSVDGLETSVNLLAFCVLIYASLREYQEPSFAHKIYASVCAGVLVLSRTDYGVVAAAVLVALFLRRTSVRGSLALAVPALTVTAPWFIWNIAVFGSPVQVSAGALPYAKHHTFAWEHASTIHVLGESCRQTLGSVVGLLSGYFGPGPGAFVLLLLPFLVALGVAASAIPGIADRARPTGFRMLFVPAIALLAQLLFHSAFRWHTRAWYFLGVFPLFALFLGVLIDSARSMPGVSWRAAPVLTMLPLFMLAKAVTLTVDGFYPVQLDMLTAARWIDAQTPRDTRIGGFNSGILSYYSGRTTVNLDGVMNPDAAAAMRERRVTAYIEGRNIQLVVDFPEWIDGFYYDYLGTPLELRPIHLFGQHADGQGPYTIWSLDHPAAVRPRDGH